MTLTQPIQAVNATLLQIPEPDLLTSEWQENWVRVNNLIEKINENQILIIKSSGSFPN